MVAVFARWPSWRPRTVVAGEVADTVLVRPVRGFSPNTVEIPRLSRIERSEPKTQPTDGVAR